MVEEKEKGEKWEMSPWEQHSAVINLPRFDYNAPSSLLHYSLSGFLITCTIKREKSATKEAISILHKYVGSFCSDDSKRLESSNANIVAKKRKTSHENGDRNDESTESKEAGNILDTPAASSAVLKEGMEDGMSLSIVKLTRSGLLLFAFPRNICPNTVDILLTIFQSLSSGSINAPTWCHRIFPIQATCCLKEEELQKTVSRLVRRYLDNEQSNLGKPIKFAVGYNRRGIDDTADTKIQKNTLQSSNESSLLLDRNRCFGVVAGAFHEVAVDSVVDLKSPELAVLVEVLPVSGMPKESPVVAVSVLPSKLITTKPRLCVKALVSNPKPLK